MKNIFYQLFFILIGLTLASCALKSKSPQIRIVGLDGKHRELATRSPELNSQALSSQGKVLENKIVNSKPSYNQAESDLVEITPDTVSAASDLGSEKKESSKNQITKNSSAILFNGSNTEEYDISDSKEENSKTEVKTTFKEKSATKKFIKKPIFISKSKTSQAEDLGEQPVKKSFAIKASKGYFAQVGSFSDERNAQNLLSKMSKFHKGIVDSSDGEKTIYRVLLGPIQGKKSANILIAKIKASGQDAVLVRK